MRAVRAGIGINVVTNYIPSSTLVVAILHIIYVS